MDERAAHAADLEQRKKKLSSAFFHYLADRGPFEMWASQRTSFREAQVSCPSAPSCCAVAYITKGDDDPSVVWEQFTTKAETKDLAHFALMLLDLCCNQGGNERTFSDVHIKQTRLRNRLGLRKLETMSKVRALSPSTCY